MKISLFLREREGWRFNPYVAWGQSEICVDRDGFLVSTPRRSFGFIRGSGFWTQRRAL